MNPVAPVPRAVVTYVAPHDMAAITLADGDVVRFGRGSDCEIRFGYAPEADEGLSRVAGRLLVALGRVMVEAPEQQGKQILRVAATGHPERLVGLGEAFSPASREFVITVDGLQRKWPLTVTVRSDDAELLEAVNEEPTKRDVLRLTPGQAHVLQAYARPVLRGLVEPATHAEVGAELRRSVSYVRETLYAIYSKMFAVGMTLQERSDKRYTVVEAARLYGVIKP